MQIQLNVQLKPFNTLNLNAVTDYYAPISSVEDLITALDFAEHNQLHVVPLSGGSNVLLPEHLHALVLHMDIQGIEVLNDNTDTVQIKVGAGQIWHDFVLFTTAQHYYGLQNLALIPGRVGAAPVQNIGAYGVEVAEFIDAVQVYDRIEKRIKVLSQAECRFAYRHSIFKQYPTRYIITHVFFSLLKIAQLRLNYGDLQRAVAENKTPENLQQHVIRIRQSKLPDPKEYPNVGSFFKNPVVSQTEFEMLLTKFEQIPHYPQSNGYVKLAAGWLIEQAGWKGKRLGFVGMYAHQALVLVNYDNASLHDVVHTYQAVQHDVKQRFNIQLEPEPVLFDGNGLIQSHLE